MFYGVQEEKTKGCRENYPYAYWVQQVWTEE